MENIQFSQERPNVLEVHLEPMVAIWKELGVEPETLSEYRESIITQFGKTFNELHEAVKGHKKKVLDSLEENTLLASKLSQELGVSFQEPDPDLVLLRIEQAVRHEVKRLQALKEEMLVEVKQLKKSDEELCARLSMDPFYISTRTVPTAKQMNELKDHIKKMETELVSRKQRVEKLRDDMVFLYEELNIEPMSDIEMSVVCENLDRFIYSTKNIDQVQSVRNGLENQLKENQRIVMECVDKIDKLYDRLQLDNNQKFNFLAENRGHTASVINSLKEEIHRLEELRRANIEKFTHNIRKELDELWDKCYYSEEQRNNFIPLHSNEYTEELLEAHEAEANKLKEHYEFHKDLFVRVSKWQDVWDKYKDLERRAKDPSRLINARGNALLLEEKERKFVNKQLPKVEEELHILIRDWEAETGTAFLVGGRDFVGYIESEREKYAQQLEFEKMAKEQAKKKNLAQESRFGARPVTPAKLKQSIMSNKTSSIKSTNSSKTNTLPLRNKKTPASSRTPGTSRILSRINTGLANLRSPRGSAKTRSAKASAAASANSSKAQNNPLRQKKRDSYGIRKDKKANKAEAALNKSKITRGILSQLDNSIVMPGSDHLQNTIDFNVRDILNSTSKQSSTYKEAHKLASTPGYMTPTKSSMFKTPSTTPRTTRGLSTLRPQSASRRNLPSLI